MLYPNDNPKRDFWVKFCQNLTFDLCVWGQILRNFKNAFTGLFVGSIRLFVRIFGQIEHAVSKRQSKTWFRGKISTKFDLWPLPVRSILGNFKNAFRACLYGQVACSCQFLSTSDLPDPNDKPKRDFGEKFGQLLTFDLSAGGQFWEISKTPLRTCF